MPLKRKTVAGKKTVPKKAKLSEKCPGILDNISSMLTSNRRKLENLVGHVLI